MEIRKRSPMEKYLIKIDEFSIKAENNICFIEIFDPTSKNAMSLLFASHMREILAFNEMTQRTVFEDFLSEEKVVLVVIRSLLENIFASGGHLKDLLVAEKKDHHLYGDSLRAFCKALNQLSQTTIAVLEGNAYGGGVELALAPDFRWSIGQNIEFHFVQTRFGVPGGWGGMTRLAELNPIFTPKRVSGIFLAQDVMNFKTLCKYSLIDKEFKNDSDCFKEIIRWRNNLFSCNPELRDDFYHRSTLKPIDLEEYDVAFFQKYFLSENHKASIHKYFEFKNNK